MLAFAIFASDKSAFYKIQLSFYDVPSIQKEKVGVPSPTEGSALAHVNTLRAELAFPGTQCCRCTVDTAPHGVPVPHLSQGWGLQLAR